MGGTEMATGGGDVNRIIDGSKNKGDYLGEDNYQLLVPGSTRKSIGVSISKKSQ